MKKTISLTLSILLLCLLPLSVFAEDGTQSVEIEFYDGEELLSQQLYTGGAVNFPAVAPERRLGEDAVEYFAGWYAEDGSFFDGSGDLSAFFGGEPLRLYAVYRETLRIYLLLETGEETLLYSVMDVPFGSTLIPPAAVELGSGMAAVACWYTDADHSALFTESSVITRDMAVCGVFGALEQDAEDPLQAPDTFQVSVNTEGQGSAEPEREAVNAGEGLTVRLIPAEGFAVESVVCAGAEGGRVNLPFENNSASLQDIHEDKTVTVSFAPDKNGDGVPDAHQTAVHFVVRGGTFGGTVQERTVYFTMESPDGSGLWQPLPAPVLGDAVPTDMTPDALHGGEGHWAESFTAETPVTAEATYHFAYAPVLSYHVLDQDSLKTETVPDPSPFTVDPNGGSFEGGTAPVTKRIEEDTLLPDPTRSGFCFWGWQYSAAEHTFTAAWEKDEVGTLTSDLKQKPDGIPDRFQKQVTYRIVNGIWADRTTIDRVNYLTLRDSDGHLSEAGYASAAAIIPENMTPAYGYVATGAKWDVKPYVMETGMNPVLYTYTFSTRTTDPATGDYSNSALWLVLMLLSAAGIAGCALMIRKKKSDKE